MPKKTNLTVSKVFKGASGEGQYGPWQIHDVYFEGSKNKYTYFEKDNYIPKAGESIDFLEWDVKETNKDGKVYTNYTIKTIMPSDEQKPSQTPSEPRDGTISCKADIGPMSMWGKYICNIMCAIIKDGHTGQELDERTKDAVETLADSSLMIMGLLKNAQCPKNRGQEKQAEPQSKDIPLPDPPPDDIPF